MASVISVESFSKALLEGLQKRNIRFVTSRGTLDCQLSEVFIEEVGELVLIPESVVSQDSIRWILETRTPIRIRLTIFTNEVTEYKLRVMRAVSDLREDGLDIPNVEDAISIQELSNRNLVRLLDSLENWHDLRTSGRPLPRSSCAGSASTTTQRLSLPASKQAEAAFRPEHGLATSLRDSPETDAELYGQLRSGIKTYWTEQYLARFLKLPLDKAREVAERVGISRELCGQEILYFFDRAKALRTYFVHLLKGILDEMRIQYEQDPNQTFFLPEFNLAVVFFDRSKEELQVFAEDYARSYDLILVVPEQLRITIGRIQDDLFRVIPLTRNHIVGALRGLVQQKDMRSKPVSRTGLGNMQ